MQTLFNWTGKKLRVWGKTYIQGFISWANAWMENHPILRDLILLWKVETVAKCISDLCSCLIVAIWGARCQECNPEQFLKLPLWIKTKVQKVKKAGSGSEKRGQIQQEKKKPFKKSECAFVRTKRGAKNGGGSREPKGLRHQIHLIYQHHVGLYEWI